MQRGWRELPHISVMRFASLSAARQLSSCYQRCHQPLIRPASACPAPRPTRWLLFRLVSPPKKSRQRRHFVSACIFPCLHASFPVHAAPQGFHRRSSSVVPRENCPITPHLTLEPGGEVIMSKVFLQKIYVLKMSRKWIITVITSINFSVVGRLSRLAAEC